jgi:hypothetical protein
MAMRAVKERGGEGGGERDVGEELVAELTNLPS